MDALHKIEHAVEHALHIGEGQVSKHDEGKGEQEQMRMTVAQEAKEGTTSAPARSAEAQKPFDDGLAWLRKQQPTTPPKAESKASEPESKHSSETRR